MAAKLSALQKYILRQAWLEKNATLSKAAIEKFYASRSRSPKARDRVSIITRSVERLIDDELVVGYGWKTPHKWYIRQLRLTPKGRRIAKTLYGVQQRLRLGKN